MEADARTTRGIIGEGESLTTAGLIIIWETVREVTMNDVVILWP